MDDAEMHRFGNVLRWLREQPGRDVVVRCPVHHEALPDPNLRAEPGHGVSHSSATGEATATRADPAEAPTSAPRPVVEVVTERCLREVQAWELVDLAVAGGADVVVEACADPAPAGLAKLGPLTAGRVRIGRLEADPVAIVQVAHPPVSRRGIFRRVVTEPVVTHESDEPGLRLVESLRALGVGAPSAGGLGEGGLGDGAPGLVLDAAACIACGVCVKACPHDALELGTAAERTTLVQYPDRCQGEQACVASCPSQVITVHGHHDWATVLAGRPLPLARVATTRCERCQITIPQGQQMCRACADRVADPFGVHLPDHLVDKLPAKYRDRLKG